MNNRSSQLFKRIVIVAVLTIVPLVAAACSGMTVSFGGGEPTVAPLIPTLVPEVDIEATVAARVAEEKDAPTVEPGGSETQTVSTVNEGPDIAATEAAIRIEVEEGIRATADAEAEAITDAQAAAEAQATADAALENAEEAVRNAEATAAALTQSIDDATREAQQQARDATATAEAIANAIPSGVVTASTSVNLRSGPDTEYRILRTSPRGTQLEVVGRSVDGEWWQVRVPDVTGGVAWVSTVYLQTENTSNVPVVQAPPLPTPTVTNTPRPTSTPTATPQTPVIDPPSGTTLNISGTPRYGFHELFADGTDQTVDFPMTVGGNIDAGDDSSLPGSCYGSVASTAPDIRIRWSGGNLVIYFRSGGGRLNLTGQSVDTTLLVNRADGSWSCNDDGLGNLQPLVNLSNAPSGIYDIYVGTYAGGSTNGTLYFGEFRP